MCDTNVTVIVSTHYYWILLNQLSACLYKLVISVSLTLSCVINNMLFFPVSYIKLE